MFDAGRAELHTEPTSPRELARAALAAVGADDLPLAIDPAVPPMVSLDRRRVAQALVGFLENAQRYAGGATRVLVSVAGDQLRFAVEDGGPGVPPDEADRIFVRFERGEHGRRQAHGTGLGLALVAEHAHLHGGRAFVEDGDVGARFTIELPLCIP